MSYVAIALLATRELAGALRRVPIPLTASLVCVLYPGVGNAHLLLLTHLPGGFGLLVLVFAMTEINDSFALLFGRLVGSPRLSLPGGCRRDVRLQWGQ